MNRKQKKGKKLDKKVFNVLLYHLVSFHMFVLLRAGVIRGKTILIEYNRQSIF